MFGDMEEHSWVTLRSTARVGNCGIRQNWVLMSPIPSNICFCRAGELRMVFTFLKDCEEKKRICNRHHLVYKALHIYYLALYRKSLLTPVSIDLP